jgi:hypothetical protein
MMTRVMNIMLGAQVSDWAAKYAAARTDQTADHFSLRPSTILNGSFALDTVTIIDY